jgi:hypothetical protein
MAKKYYRVMVRQQLAHQVYVEADADEVEEFEDTIENLAFDEWNEMCLDEKFDHQMIDETTYDPEEITREEYFQESGKEVQTA